MSGLFILSGKWADNMEKKSLSESIADLKAAWFEFEWELGKLLRLDKLIEFIDRKL